MKYYQLVHSINPQEVGVTYPQSQTARHPISTDNPKHLDKQFAGFLKDIPLPEPIVHPDAKLSDLLSSTVTWRLVISLKLKNILEKFMQPDQCQFLEMTVHYLNNPHRFWMLNPLLFNMELIDFDVSETWLCGAGATKIRKLEIDSLASFDAYSQTLHMPERASIYNVSFVADADADFIQLRNASGMNYVSEKLRDELIKEGCTGISFKELE